MSFYCLNCCECWDFEDYTCPNCGKNTIDFESTVIPTLKYKIKYFNEKDKKKFNADFEYDVIRLTTNKSIFKESSNYMNQKR